MKLLTAILTGIVTTIPFCTSPAFASQSFDTEVIKQADQKWHFRHVRARSIDGAVRISGRMTAHNHIGVPQGHLDIAVFSPSGELITETTANYSPSTLSRRLKQEGGVRFSSVIADDLPDGSVIKVAFHRDQQVTSVPLHTRNIAR